MSFDLALINNDLCVNNDGTIKTITDTPKLRQDIIKIVLTPIGSVKNYLWYGCSLGDSIIGQQMADTFMASRIQQSITQSLDRLKAMQDSQATMQKVTLAEMIEMLGGVDVERDIDDPRRINIVITVFSKNLAKIEELFTIIS